MQASHVRTGYYGEGGSIAPVFSFGRVPLVPSFLTGDGSHAMLWTSVLLHVVALAINITANAAYFINSHDTSGDLLKGWAYTSLISHILAVIGTVVYTALVKDTFSKPMFSTFGIGLFLTALLSTAKISYTHATAMAADSVENVNYNLSLFFQAFALASLIANSLAALAKNVGL